MKSTVGTYFWWIFTGWFGGHHFYLGRDRHAFVWWCTLGGVFGLGWLRDAWRIPDYVDEANEDEAYEVKLHRRLKNGRPPFNTTRFAGELIVGSLFGFATRLALPDDLVWLPRWRWLPYLLIPYAVALGVHLVGNIGRECGSLKSALIGAYLALPLYDYSQDSCISYSAVISAVSFNWIGKRFRHRECTTRRPRSVCVRMWTLILACSLYGSLWGSFVYHNATIHLNDEEIRVKVAIDSFLSSPEWIKLKHSVNRLLIFGYEHGWEKLFEEILLSVFERVDPEKTEWAEMVLNSTLADQLSGGGGAGSGSGGDMNRRCRELMAKYHPDRQREAADKEEAARKFMDIQAACQHLTGRRRGRSRGN